MRATLRVSGGFRCARHCLRGCCVTSMSPRWVAASKVMRPPTSASRRVPAWTAISRTALETINDFASGMEADRKAFF